VTVEELRSRLFLSVPEAAAMLGVDERTCRRAIRAGDVPAVRVSGVWRIPAAKIRAMAGLDSDDGETMPSDESG
jgi:excisionase family DNA binding protein